MTYCTITQARTAGAIGDDAAVLAAIAAAARLVDRYTGAIWETTALTIVARVEADGTVFLPYVVQSVTSVTPVGAAAALPPASYLTLSSTTLGQIDALILGGASLADPLVLGAEPWAGGYANLLGRAITGQVTVVGTFGPTVTPSEVTDATAALAAWRTQTGGVVRNPGAVQVDDEGDTVSVVLAADEVRVRVRTTGLASADAILAPLIRDLIRVS